MMKDIMLKKGSLGYSLSTHNSFKSFVILVVMLLMTTSNALGAGEIIGGFRCQLDPETKTAILYSSPLSLSDIVVPEKVKSKDGTEYLVVALGQECFSTRSNLLSVTIPSSVKSLGYRCFEGCKNLKSIVIPSSVTELGQECFSRCSSLTSVSIPSSITELSDGCFEYCSSLTSITIPSSVKSLGEVCFADCKKLLSITIPSSVTTIGAYCFSSCYKLTSVSIPLTVTSLGYGCFAQCISLTSITIPSSVTSLKGYCFSGCSGLTSVSIPSSLASIGEGCFRNCNNLKSITIPSSVTELGPTCFTNCSNLTSITIPSSVTSIGQRCFDSCNLYTLYFKGKLPLYLFSPFEGIPTRCIIKVPTEYLQAYKEAFGPDYKFISVWHPNDADDENKFVTQCATPSVSYESGKLKFDCETIEAKYHYTISDKDIAKDVLSEDGNVELSAAYKISVYATANGHTDSDKAEVILNWFDGKLENDANINLARTRGIMVSTLDGIISISGLINGEIVKFYAADGKLIGSTPAIDGVASYATSEAKVIAKIGTDVINILIK